MKQYIYRKKYYDFKVVYIGYFVIAIALYAIYNLLSSVSALWIFVLLICAYQIINTFFSLANPQEIDISDRYIEFKGMGKSHLYNWNEVKDFRVKEFVSAKKIYLRINKDDFSLLKGRYWIDCMYFNDSDELFMYFVRKEDELHPDTIKAYAHRSSMTPEQKEKANKKKKTVKSEEKGDK